MEKMHFCRTFVSLHIRSQSNLRQSDLHPQVSIFILRTLRHTFNRHMKNWFIIYRDTFRAFSNFEGRSTRLEMWNFLINKHRDRDYPHFAHRSFCLDFQCRRLHRIHRPDRPPLSRCGLEWLVFDRAVHSHSQSCSFSRCCISSKATQEPTNTVPIHTGYDKKRLYRSIRQSLFILLRSMNKYPNPSPSSVSG